MMNIFVPLVNLDLLFLVALGTLAGILVGAIPGLSVTMATTLLVSLTFGWGTHEALALMVGIYCGGVYGGSRSAILINIPGAPAAIATTFDGYPLAQKGEAGQAIGVSTVQSFIGGILGVIVLAIGAPIISNIALGFAPRDYFLLATLGILLVGSLGSSSLSKALVAAALGIAFGLIGMDPVTGEQRFTFGQIQLMSGINYITAMIGLFGLSEAFVQIKDRAKPHILEKVGSVIPSLMTTIRHLPLSIQTSILGIFAGALPGVGGDIAALLAYDHAKRVVKKPSRPFGQGALEGIVAPESANNAAIGGAFIPMLTLGIPGDAVTAVLIGALFIHGLRPGPMLMVDTPDLFWVIVGSLVLANIFMLIFGLSFTTIFTRISYVPKGILMPIVVVLSVVGSYSIQNNLTDVYWMIGFGFFGYLLRQYGYPLGPMVLGMILGPLMDINFRRALISVHGDVGAFTKSLITNPISLVLTLGIVIALAIQVRRRKEIPSPLAGTGEASEI